MSTSESRDEINPLPEQEVVPAAPGVVSPKDPALALLEYGVCSPRLSETVMPSSGFTQEEARRILDHFLLDLKAAADAKQAKSKRRRR